MKKNYKGIIITLFVILIIFILFVCIFVINRKQEEHPFNQDMHNEYIENSEITSIDSTVKSVDIRNNYYIVKNCIMKYYIFVCNENNSSENTVNIQEKIYSMLDKEYIKYKGIDKYNILDKINFVDSIDIDIKNMYVSQRSFDISVYFVYGTIMENNEKNNFSIMVKVDRTNKTFSVFLEDYINEKYPEIKSGNTINFNDTSNIEKNDMNVYNFKNVSDETYTKDIFGNIKNYIMTDNELLYELLSDECKSNFNDYNEFHDYISNNYLDLIKISYNGFEKSKLDEEITLYVIKEKNEKFEFLVYEIRPFNYSVEIKKL